MGTSWARRKKGAEAGAGAGSIGGATCLVYMSVNHVCDLIKEAEISVEVELDTIRQRPIDWNIVILI